jgi:RelA/SpoT family (p)ppGpp synthetase
MADHGRDSKNDAGAPPDAGAIISGEQATLTGEAADAQNSIAVDQTAASAPLGVAAQADADGSQAVSGKDAAAGTAKKAAQPAPVGLIRQFELVDRVRAYDPHVNEDMLNRAYVFSMKAHGGQTRKSGDPYFTHPLAVAAILTDLKADPASVITGLLHDVVEDTDTTIEDIRKLFGDEIAHLVDGVTKLSQIELKSEASKQAENFRKLVVAMADDVRVLLVKLADRLHNMRTLQFHQKEEKRRLIALETMEIYAPLAGRIGVQKFREELEDLSFQILSPQAQETISLRLEDLREHVATSVVALAQTLRQKLADAGLHAEVYSREKRAYSIWRKMATKNVSFDELADIYAFRVIVRDVDECYRALGAIHSTWRMIPSEFDDYISAPKPNNYRSIHTAVIGPPRSDGGRQRIEIQIRTHAMHDTAERGVAAHWQYKDTNGGGGGAVEIIVPGLYDPYETPRRLVEMFQHGDDPEEALRYAKLELFQDQVFCFTPKGRVIALPKGATGLDFAYAVHTDVGDACIGVKINGVSRPLRTALKNGDVILVLRSDHAPVPPEWESMAVTGRARAAIRRRVKKMQNAEHVELGRSMAENVFSGAHLELSAKAIRAALTRLNEKTVDDVFAKVGRGDLAVADLVEAVYPGASHETEGEIRAAGMKPFRPRLAIDHLPPGVSVTMGRCCSPIPGERIVGIRDEAGDVTVHAIDCETLAAEDPPQSYWLDIGWREGKKVDAYARVTITVRNEIGVLSDVAAIVARYGVSIANIRLENRPPDFVDFFVDVVLHDIRQLEHMLAGLRASAHVLSAERNERTVE